MRKDTFQATFLGLLFLYITLIILVLLFSSRLIPDISKGYTVQGWILLLLAVFFLLFLLGMVVLNILRLFRDRYSRKPGVRFKVRLVGFFILISAVSSIPQGFLSVSFLHSAVNTIFHPSLREALEGGLSIAITYYDEKIEHLRSIGRNRYAQQILEQPDRATVRAWNNLRSLYPDLAAYQVFSAKGENLFFAGNTEFSIDGIIAVSAPEGVLPRETKSGGLTILRFKQVISTDPNRPIAILSLSLPDSFDRNAERITTTLNTFTQLEQHRTRFNATVILIYSFFALPLLLLSILVSFLLSDEIIRPIVNIEEATRRVAEGDFSYRILSRSKDDLFHLADSFNRMVTELEKSRRTLVQAEKVTAWQEIAQQLAHEIKNPLTPIKLSAERLLKKYQEDREQFERVLHSSVETILKETNSLDKLLKEFKDFSRLPTPVPRPVPLKQILEEAVQGYRYTPHIQITVDPIPASFTLMADADQIRQLFTNLFTNSIEAMPEGGQIRIRADLVKKGNSRYCRIMVSDTGVGIPEEYRNLVFNPYFTTKSQGTGLGLSIVERIIFDHKGQIWFESEQGKGTTFFIDLPLESGE